MFGGDQPSDDLLAGGIPAAYADLMAAVSSATNGDGYLDAPLYSPRATLIPGFASLGKASGPSNVGRAEATDGAHAASEASAGHGGAGR